MNRRPLGRRRVLGALVAITVLALFVRLFALGFRVFHWDEARVGYWTLRYLESGVWEYRPIVHGPFLFHVNEVLFSVFGTADVVARLTVALVGGLLPLGAWLFRERLRDVEVVLLGAFLALNPVLVYYSRFMRNDLLVAGFALLSVGMFVRLLDTGRSRYLYAGVGFLGLGFATKEIALVYLAVWLGAVALLLDHRLFAARETGRPWQDVATEQFGRTYRALVRFQGPVVIAVLELFLLVVVFYAPRPDLYQALANPAQLPGVVEAATVGTWDELYGLWISGGQDHSYIAYLMDQVETTAFTSLPLVAFAVLGFVVDRYAGDGPRDVVAFGFYWGLAIYLIYPAITDISAPWAIVHPVVPLAIPAAVGLGLIVDRGLDAHASEDWVGVGLAALVVLAIVAQVGVTAIDTSYRSPQADTNPLVQYGQPAGYLHPTIADIEGISRANEGTDVLFYGEHFFVANESETAQPPEPGNWPNRLPLAWYLERADAEVDSTTSLQDVDGDTPIVIARAEHFGDLNRQLTGYEALTYELTSSGSETVIFVRADAREDART